MSVALRSRRVHLSRVGELSGATFDTLAALFGQVEHLDRVARASIAQQRDAATADYVEFVEDNFPDAHGRVVQGLVPVKLWAWVERDEGLTVVLDYSWAPRAMDHVLSARFDASASLQRLSMES